MPDLSSVLESLGMRLNSQLSCSIISEFNPKHSKILRRYENTDRGQGLCRHTVLVGQTVSFLKIILCFFCKILRSSVLSIKKVS